MLKDAVPGNNPLFIASMVAVGLMASWAASAACRRIKLPAVVGHILVGMVMGVCVLGIFTYQNMKGLSFMPSDKP